MAPKWITLNDTFIRGTIEVIGSRLELYQVMESMPCGRNPRVERGPSAAAVKHADASRANPQCRPWAKSSRRKTRRCSVCFQQARVTLRREGWARSRHSPTPEA